MKKKLSKILVLTLSFLMVFTMSATAFAADDAETLEAEQAEKQQQKDEQVVQDNLDKEMQIFSNGAVKISKTLTPTGIENFFDVHLKVVTTENVEQVDVSPNAGVVLVLDKSISMDNKRLAAAKSAAETFIKTFTTASNELNNSVRREIGIVSFGDAAQINKGLTSVTNCTEESKNVKDLISAVNGIKGDRSTNIQGGLETANTMLNNAGFAEKERYILLFTDGKPTFHDGDDQSNPGDTEHTDHEAVWDDNENKIGNILKSSDTTVFSVYLGNSNDKMECLNQDCEWHSNHNSGKTVIEWLGLFSNEIYHTSDMTKLGEIFEKISKWITTYANAWVVTDPMGDNIEFVSTEGLNVVLNEDKTELAWNLKDDVVVPDSDGVREYNLTYRVRLNNVAADFTEGKAYDTNGKTILKYFLSNQIVNGIPPEKLSEAEFVVPSVKGYLADIKINKTSTDEKALEGAKFKLEGTNGYKTTTLTSDGDGKVVFSNIPSGYEYTLTEINAPNGYIKDTTQRTIKVAYDKVYDITDGNLTEITDGFKWVNTPITPEVTGSLTLKKTIVGLSDAELSSLKDVLSFTVTKPDGTKETVKYSQFIDGAYTLNNLPVGTYTIVENNAGVSDYTLTTTVMGAVKGETGYQTDVSGGETPIDVSFSNTYVKNIQPDPTGSLTLKKTIVGLSDAELSSLKDVLSFTVTKPDGTKETVNYSQFIDGAYTLNNLPIGTYTIVENNAGVSDYTLTTTVMGAAKEGAGYLTVVSGGEIPIVVQLTNTYSKKSEPIDPPPTTTYVTVNKVWNDNNNEDGVRPASVTVNVLDANNKVVATVELNDGNNWTKTVFGLPIDGTYRVEEVAVNGYTAAYSQNGNIYTVTNTKKALPPEENIPEEPNTPDTPDVDIPEKPELPDDEGVKGETPADEGMKDEDPDQPKTGDESNMAGWLAVLATSLAALGVTFVARRKENE